MGVVWEKVGRIRGCLSFSTGARDRNIALAAGTGAWITLRGGVHPGQDKIAPAMALLPLSSDGFIQAFLHLSRLG